MQKLRKLSLAMTAAWAFAPTAWSQSSCSPFAVSGTNTHDDVSLSAAFDGAHFVVALEGGSAPHYAGVRRIDTLGQLVGGLATLAFDAHEPRLASGGGQTLVAAIDRASGPDHDVSAQILGPGGAFGPVLPISRAGGKETVLGVGSDGTDFLVVYEREVSPATEQGVVRGRVVSAAGVVGPELAISSGLGDHARNDVAFDGSNYLVVWTDDLFDSEVRGRFISSAGVLGAEFAIDSSPAVSDESVTLAFDGANYLVVFGDEFGAPQGWDLYARPVSPAGAVGGLITLSTELHHQALQHVVFDGANFLVSWTDLRNDANDDFVCDTGEGTCIDVLGRRVSPAGALVGGEVLLGFGPGSQFLSPLAAGAGKVLSAWADGDVASGGDVWARLIDSSGCPVVEPYCFGDGTGLACPCANTGASGHGCANSVFASGALLASSGTPSVAADTFVLLGSAMPNSTAVYFQGTAQNEVVLDDGFGCVGGSIIRLGTKTNAGNASSYPQAGNLAISVRGAIPAAGATRYYQCFYRNAAAAFCPPATSNRTNGLAATWIP
ncbi:MAG: hypothetical protein HZA53_00870 [Planctomycetes bacterium]|nr:hypothetical protein [Planctomycetota bacterium]